MCRVPDYASGWVIEYPLEFSLSYVKGESAMPTYVSLINWTDQGIRNT